MSGHSNHYILPDRLAVKTGLALLGLTLITVAISYLHFGAWNFIIGMLVATIKAILVAGIFMNLRKDSKSNLVIFLTGFLFLAIFIVLTATDILYRGDVYTNNQSIFKNIPGAGGGKFQKPWEPTPELVAHGKAVFAQQCTSCHGETGQGNGVAAAALNPPPRNFHAVQGWKNGRKPSQIFKTLAEGLSGSAMAAYTTLPAEDRWALAHFVGSLGPEVLKDTSADYAAIGFDPNKAGSESAAKSILIDDAIVLISKSVSGKPNLKADSSSSDLEFYESRLKAATFSK